MKTLILFLLLPMVLFAQQLSHTWGQTTAGVAYTQTGYADADSATTINIVFDMQDYYFTDFLPVASDDSVIILNSTRLNYGTFWWKIEAENATDSTGHSISAYPGFMDYYPGSGPRLATNNIGYSSTATTLISETAAVSDLQWSAVNVYLSDAEGKILPPEFIKIAIAFQTLARDSIDVYWDFVMPVVNEDQQSKRTTTNPANAKKSAETLH